MNQHEIPLRNILKEKFRRGRFDVSISMTSGGASQLKINKDLAKSIFSAFKTLREELSIPGEIGIETLAGFREILIEEEPEYDIEALYNTFREAASNLEEMRSREGALLVEDARRRMESLSDMNNKIKALAPAELTIWREKFLERLKSIVDPGTVDPSRVVQEAAIMAEKLDISEELTRLENHTQQFIEILDAGDASGKKLDFLLQEINREVNTLTSKSVDYSISRLAVEMKTEAERIREQIQNLQ